MRQIYFDWELCRVREGYYQVRSGIDYCIQRACAYAVCNSLFLVPRNRPSHPSHDGMFSSSTSAPYIVLPFTTCICPAVL
jgi:hypothetical protein